MNWLTNLEQAKEEAAKSKKIILLQFEMDNCGGCKKLEATTYKDQKTIDEMNEWFVLLKLDLIKDREVRRILGAYWTPAIYFLDQNGNSFYHFNGYLPANEFRAILRLGIAETIIPRGKYDDIIKIIDKDLDELSLSSLYPKLLVARETARYIKIKDNSQLRKTLKEIQQKFPDSLEAKMYFWDE
ncbi:MAG: thioredoxin family protein [Ignavibacterium sp.]|nr:thioredoxin family protein [Ignavibacterium sp.]